MIKVQNIFIAFGICIIRFYLTFHTASRRFVSVYFARVTYRTKLKWKNKSRWTYRTVGWTVSWPGELEHATPERESKTTNQGVELG